MNFLHGIWVFSFCPLFQNELSLVNPSFSSPSQGGICAFLLLVYLVSISFPPRAKLHYLSVISAGLITLFLSRKPGSWDSAHWTLNWFLIPGFSCVCAGSAVCSVSEEFCFQPCSDKGLVLWSTSCPLCPASLWFKPPNHKYSPAGKQTRAEMKTPEAQEYVSLSQGIRMMFYVMKPNETSFQTLEEVPDYVKQVRLSRKRLLLLFLKKSDTSWGLVYFHSSNYEILIKIIPFHKDMEQK